MESQRSSTSAHRWDLDRRRFLGLGAVAGAGVALSGCGGTSQPPGAAAPTGAFGAGSTYGGPNVTLAFWNGLTGGDGPFMQKLVDQFNSAHPNIAVKMTVMQWGDFYSKVPNAVASGSGPDMGLMHIDQLATNAARQVIIPLDEAASALKLQEGDFNPVVWKAGIYKAKRYGIPLDIHPLGLYANTALLQKGGTAQLPGDRSAWDAAVAGMKKGGVEFPFWVTATWPAHLMFISLLNQFGGTLYTPDGGKAQFASDAGAQALSWLVSWIQKGDSPKDVANDAQAQAFRQGRNALTWDGIWMMNEWAKVPGLQWAAAPVPTIGSRPAVWASSHNFVVMRQPKPDSNKLQAARVFIAWISERSIEWAKSGQIPARNSVRESAEFKTLTVQSTLAAQLPHVVFPPAVPGIGDVTTPTFETAVNLAVLGKQDPKSALADAAKKADQLLADNRAKYGG